jgi:plasmid stability protein
MMYAMPSLVQIRNVPEGTRRALKARAAARGESLNAYLLELLEREAARPTVAEVLERAARRAERVEAAALDIVDADRAEREEQLLQRALD